MKQRIITAAFLVAILLVFLFAGGVVASVMAAVFIVWSVHEEYQALSKAGHRPVAWPTWLGMAASVPLFLLGGSKVLFPVFMAVCLLTFMCATFRKDPVLEDTMMSVLPLLTIYLPGLCMLSMTQIEPRPLQIVTLFLLFAVPVLSDTFAYFVGSFVGGPKLCPQVSPNKTIAGALGGLGGGLLGAALVGIIAPLCVGSEVLPMLPAWWHYLLLGLIGSVAAQMGDLFASMVKRHCGVKDFSNLFPGHGGMMDRLDSIYFMAVVMYCYRLLLV